MNDTELVNKFRESVHYHGHMICDGCNSEIDFSDCDTVEAGIDKWNGHIEREHSDD